MSFQFRGQPWLPVQENRRKLPLLFVTLGMTEEHGSHEPVDIDSRIARVARNTWQSP